MSFGLDPRLAADSHIVGDFELCRVLLMKDSRYPWRFSSRAARG